MSKMFEYLIEAANVSVNYPNLYKPKDVWKIREDNHYSYGRPDNGYLSVSFVMDRNLKWPDLGFNLVVQVMNGGRTIIFLSEEDAKEFLRLANANYPDLSKYNLIVSKGRGGDELVRINYKTSIPCYTSKGAVEWLSNLEDTKVPQEIRDRLTGDTLVPEDQKQKEEAEKNRQQKILDFNTRLYEVYKELDPNINTEAYGKVLESLKPEPGAWVKRLGVNSKDLEFTYGRFIVKVSIPNKNYDQLSLSGICINDTNIDMTDKRGEVRDLLDAMYPELKSVKNSIKNSEYIYITTINLSGSFKYPALRYRINWDKDRIKQEVITYLDRLHDIIYSCFGEEEFDI